MQSPQNDINESAAERAALSLQAERARNEELEQRVRSLQQVIQLERKLRQVQESASAGVANAVPRRGASDSSLAESGGLVANAAAVAAASQLDNDATVLYVPPPLSSAGTTAARDEVNTRSGISHLLVGARGQAQVSAEEGDALSTGAAVPVQSGANLGV